MATKLCGKCPYHSTPPAPTADQIRAWLVTQPATLIGAAFNVRDPVGVEQFTAWLTRINGGIGATGVQ